MYRLLTISFLIIFLACSQTPEESISPVRDLELRLTEISGMEDPELRTENLDVLWDSLVTNEMIPLTYDTTVVFLYRGDAESVEWNGDFNSWSNNPRFDNEGTQIPNTDVWMLKQSFPSAARLDYKITLNGEDWILDPNNPHEQWGGFGPNSELRMPDWNHDPLTQRDESTARGTLSSDNIISSEVLGYKISYKVYTPAGYENFRNLPVLYVTDGQEYSDERLGALPIVLDHLIEDQRIEPLIAVFVDPRSPEDQRNRRMTELAANPMYLNFYINELMPVIHEEYKTSDNTPSAGILGTSMGGLNAAYFAFSRPDVFESAAIQSPAFWYHEEIFDLVRDFEGDPPKIYMSTGTIGDVLDGARTMKEIFDEKGYLYEYTEVPEGHSWGAWRAQMDEIMIYLYGN